MIIDAHIHLWNPLHGKDFGIDRQALSWGKAREGDRVYYATPPAFEDSQSTYERALAHMEWLNIDRAVVLQEFADGKQDDYLAQVRQAEPTRFSCTALLDQHYYEDPVGCFQEAIEKKNLQGFLVKSPDPLLEIAVPELMPLWERCAERGLPVVCKNGVPDDIRKLIAAVPELKVVLSHFAGSFGPEDEYRERIEIVASSPNVYVDSGALTFRQRHPFSEAKERLHEAVEIIGADKIAWGSDYPRPGLVADASYKQQLEFITVECDFLSEEQQEQILGKTALRVYKWDE
ncbi:MAG: amidohydrolase family protein [Chloroflexota bacterium]|nr:amidohydrolase family protein [Chloroflexota bacterium]